MCTYISLAIPFFMLFIFTAIYWIEIGDGKWQQKWEKWKIGGLKIGFSDAELAALCCVARER